ncbi:hypothetical protein NQ318_016415 [Aromia moschata]|uniref:MCM N-terminal domain-containing protein n=1 Tax=Aromia moschata TaxID=1265417 RepID=A0AAV8Z5L6_9CUCU|nr:hypothetical protein NQ318_016415 [Aromia moschata]
MIVPRSSGEGMVDTHRTPMCVLGFIQRGTPGSPRFAASGRSSHRPCIPSARAYLRIRGIFIVVVFHAVRAFKPEPPCPLRGHIPDEVREYLSSQAVYGMSHELIHGRAFIHTLEEPFLNVNCAHLEKYDSNLYRQLICYPQEVIPSFDMTVNQMFFERYPAGVLEHQIQVRPFNAEKTRNMRALNPEANADSAVSTLNPFVSGNGYKRVKCETETKHLNTGNIRIRVLNIINKITQKLTNCVVCAKKKLDAKPVTIVTNVMCHYVFLVAFFIDICPKFIKMFILSKITNIWFTAGATCVCIRQRRGVVHDGKRTNPQHRPLPSVQHGALKPLPSRKG